MVGSLNGFGFFSSGLLPITIFFLFIGINMCRVSMDFVTSEMFSRLIVLRIVANGQVYLETNKNKKYGTGWKNIKEGYFTVIEKTLEYKNIGPSICYINILMHIKYPPFIQGCIIYFTIWMEFKIGVSVQVGFGIYSGVEVRATVMGYGTYNLCLKLMVNKCVHEPK